MNEQQQGTMPEQGPAGPWSSARFFAWLRHLGVTRSDERWLAGVCGAIAERTGLDPLVVRGVAVVVALLGGPVLLAYAVGWALIPDSSGRIHAERVLRGIVDPAIVAIGIMVVLTFVPTVQGIWWRGVPVAWGMPGWLQATLGTAWTIALVGGAVWLVVLFARRGADRAPDPGPAYPGTAPHPGTAPRRDAWTSPDDLPDAGAMPGTSVMPDAGVMPEAGAATDAGRASWQWTPPNQQDRQRQQEERVRAQRSRDAERRARRRAREASVGFVAISLGLAVVAGAGVAAWAQQADLPVAVLGVATALAVLAAATIVSGIRGRESGGLGFLAVVAAIALVVTGVLPAGTQVSVIGGTTWRPDVVPSGTERDYAMVVGGPTIDLRGLDESDGGGSVDLWLAVGGATIRLPDDAPVRVQVSGAAYGVDTGTDEDSVGGVLGTTVLENRAARSARAETTTDVHVWILAGGVDVPRAVTVQGGTGR